jgi:hypothetical protein
VDEHEVDSLPPEAAAEQGAKRRAKAFDVPVAGVEAELDQALLRVEIAIQAMMLAAEEDLVAGIRKAGQRPGHRGHLDRLWACPDDRDEGGEGHALKLARPRAYSKSPSAGARRDQLSLAKYSISASFRRRPESMNTGGGKSTRSVFMDPGSSPG